MLLLSLFACVESPILDPGPPPPGVAPTATGGPTEVVERQLQSCPEALDVVLAVDPAGVPGLERLPSLLDPLLGAGTSVRLGVLDIDATATSGLVLQPVDEVADPTALLPVPSGASAPALLDRLHATVDAAVEPTADLLIVGWLGSPDTSTLPEPDFESWLDGADPERSQLWVVGPTEATDPLLDLALATGGEAGEPTADRLLAAGLAGLRAPLEVHLSQVPDLATLELSVTTPDGIELAFDDGEWTWDAAANAVGWVDYVPDCGATVEVTYLPL